MHLPETELPGLIEEESGQRGHDIDDEKNLKVGEMPCRESKRKRLLIRSKKS